MFYIDDVTNYDLVFYDACCFVNYNVPRIVDNNISDLKLTIHRQILCSILIARPLNINKNIPHRPEVQRIGAPNSLNATLPAQACSNEVCYQMEM